MIHDFNRDLLLLSKTAHLDPEELDRQMELLNTLLYHVENWQTFCNAHEVIDINRRKIISSHRRIERILRKTKQKAFVFTNNKN